MKKKILTKKDKIAGIIMMLAGALLLTSFFLPVFNELPKDLLVKMPDGFTFSINRGVWAFFFGFLYHKSRYAHIGLYFTMLVKDKRLSGFFGIITLVLGATAFIDFSVGIGCYFWFGSLVCIVVGRIIKEGKN